jgi:putative toxin-antitoxin system antitoxin component (TIGR02293 family)
MAKNFSQLRAHTSPGSQARSAAKTQAMLAEMPLDELRQGRELHAHKRATEVLGSEQLADQWLHREIRSLGGEQPVSLLDTEAGFELVMDTLGRIESGIVA